MKTAIIFAAGRGERLRPITDTTPKALCQVQGVPLIEHHILGLAKAEIKNIIINHAHLGGYIRNYLGTGERYGVNITYSPEPPGALETGGALINAFDLIGNDPFITVNGDILTDYDFSNLTLPKSHTAHLVLVPQPSYYNHADFGLTENGEITNQNKRFTFSGIACYHPTILNNLKPGRFSITPIIRKHADAKNISGSVHQGQWLDIGSPERLLLAK